jgi:hypothetical protein
MTIELSDGIDLDDISKETESGIRSAVFSFRAYWNIFDDQVIKVYRDHNAPNFRVWVTFKDHSTKSFVVPNAPGAPEEILSILEKEYEGNRDRAST